VSVFAGAVPCAACGLPLPEALGGQARCVCGTEQQVLRFAPHRPQAPAPVAELLEVAGRDVPCAYHARNAASVECSRCGSFICGLCALRVARQVLCPPCFERRWPSGWGCARWAGEGSWPSARTTWWRPPSPR
jgi:hypothetical protein